MPALVAFGRRWKVGSDDFLLPGLIDVTVKFCWFVAAVVTYVQNDKGLECSSGRHLRYYLYGIFTSLLVIILVDLVAMKTTMRGYIMDTDARKFLPACIYLRLSCEAIDVCWNLLGTIWVFGGNMHCPEAPDAVYFIKRFILCNWCSLVILALFMTWLFDPLGQIPPKLSRDPMNSYAQNYLIQHEASWEKKLKKLCCYWGGGGEHKENINAGFKEAARIFSVLLRDHDFVSTDVWAGFIALYQREQDRRLNVSGDSSGTNEASIEDNYKKLVQSLENENHHPSITRQPVLLQKENLTQIIRDFGGSVIAVAQEEYYDDYTRSLSSDAVQDIALINYYLNYVLGSFGWLGFVSHHYKNRAVRRLWKQLYCFSCFRSQRFHVVGDNCCLCSTGAIQETAKINPKDLVYVSFKNEIYLPVFYVALDHKNKSIVLSIRGTMSLADSVSDLTAAPTSIDFPGIPSSFKAFHGATLCAKRIREILQEKKVLDELQLKYPEYNLVIIGFSLGAGAGTILGMMYIQKFPGLRVFAISPIGGLLNLDGAKYTENFTTTVVYGDDMVPRISLPSIDRLKTKIIRAIVDSRTPKYQILLNGMSSVCCGSASSKFSTRIEFARNLQGHYNTVVDLNGDIPKHSVIRPGGREKASILTYPMFLPGRILHITEKENWTDLQGGPRWKMRWADRSEFSEIIVSPRMYKDHLHFRMQKALHECVVANRDSVTLNLM